MNRKEPIGQEFCRGSIRIDRSHDPSTSHSPNTSQGSIDPMAPAHGIKPAFCSLLSVPLKGLWWWKGLEGLTQRSALCRWKTKQRKRWSAGHLGLWGCLQRVWTFHLPHGPSTFLSSHPHHFPFSPSFIPQKKGKCYLMSIGNLRKNLPSSSCVPPWTRAQHHPDHPCPCTTPPCAPSPPLSAHLSFYREKQ